MTLEQIIISVIDRTYHTAEETGIHPDSNTVAREIIELAKEEGFLPRPLIEEPTPRGE